MVLPGEACEVIRMDFCVVLARWIAQSGPTPTRLLCCLASYSRCSAQKIETMRDYKVERKDLTSDSHLTSPICFRSDPPQLERRGLQF